MGSIRGLLLITFAICVTVVYQQSFSRAAQDPSQKKPATSTPTPTPANPNDEVNKGYVKKILSEIAGRENEPSEKVFKNIQLPLLKSVPARRMLLIMNLGFSRALGVSCNHCHVDTDFASDDKRPKRAAREMSAMHRMINEQLAKMQNLGTKAEDRAINCSTCHRGAVNPMATSR